MIHLRRGPFQLGDIPYLRLEHCSFAPTTGSLRSVFILHCLLALPLLQESETNQRLMYRDVRQVQRLLQILLILRLRIVVKDVSDIVCRL
jgi:hypothetical protein